MNSYLISQIREERERQDKQWGGPAHDDKQRTGEWLDYIGAQIGKSDRDVVRYALDAIKQRPAPTVVDEIEGDRIVRARLVKIAALAVAGVESIDRKLARRHRFFWIGEPSEVYVAESLEQALEAFAQPEDIEEKQYGEVPADRSVMMLDPDHPDGRRPYTVAELALGTAVLPSQLLSQYD